MIFLANGMIRRLQNMWAAGALSLLLCYVLWPWFPWNAVQTPPQTLVFYGFSILGEVMNQAIFPAFQELWKKKTGKRIELVSSFSGSGTVTNQLIMGVPADLALLSLELDALRLNSALGISPESWRSLPHHGVVNRTPFIILVRSGNPKNIRSYADLSRPGMKVVHPDPLTSGGANWAILAEYGAGARFQGRWDRPQAGYDLLLGIWRNIVAQAPSARAARTQFENGFGDALITYEQEAIWDKSRGKLEADIVYPPSTILSEHILVRLDRNIASDEQEAVDAFISFLWSDLAQRLFIHYGFRSVTESLNVDHADFGSISDPFTVADFGGWIRAKQEIVEGVWKAGVLKELRH